MLNYLPDLDIYELPIIQIQCWHCGKILTDTENWEYCEEGEGYWVHRCSGSDWQGTGHKVESLIYMYGI